MAERLSDAAALDDIEKDVVAALEPDHPPDAETIGALAETLERAGRPLFREVIYAGEAANTA